MGKISNQKLKEGDTDSFSLLFKQTHPRLMGYCQLFVKNQKDAEDIVQECFYNLWENRQKIKPDKSVESLLFVSLRNRCLNYLKEESKFNFSSLQEGFVPNEFQYLYQIDFTEKKELSLEEQLIDALKKAIDELPQKNKEALLKNKVEGYKQKEIAVQMGISIKTVEKYLHDAKKELRSKLENNSLLYHLFYFCCFSDFTMNLLRVKYLKPYFSIFKILKGLNNISRRCNLRRVRFIQVNKNPVQGFN